MSYCGICDSHDVTFSKVEGGWYCSGCDEIQYDDDIEKYNIEKTLRAAKSGKANGWKIYPNWEGMGEPIDEVIQGLESRLLNQKP